MSVELAILAFSAIGGGLLLKKKAQAASPIEPEDKDDNTSLGEALVSIIGEDAPPVLEQVLSGDVIGAVGGIIEDPAQAFFGVDKEAARAAAALNRANFAAVISGGVADRDMWDKLVAGASFNFNNYRDTAAWAFYTAMRAKYGVKISATNKGGPDELAILQERWVFVRDVFDKSRMDQGV